MQVTPPAPVSPSCFPSLLARAFLAPVPFRPQTLVQDGLCLGCDICVFSNLKQARS